jgi:hypothetical protein
MKLLEHMTYLRHYRAKLHMELDQMHYGTAPEGLESAQVEVNDSA